MALTVEEAGIAYLAAVCPSNKASEANQAAYEAEDLARITATAAEMQVADRNAAAALDDPMKVWPEDVAADVDAVRDTLLQQIASDNQVVAATSVEAARAVIYPAGSGLESQRIRLRLNLSADTSVGC